MFFKRTKKHMFAITAILLLGCFYSLSSDVDDNKPNDAVARYDLYQLYELVIRTNNQNSLFSNLNRVGDSYICFTDYRQNPLDNLTILVAPHRVADFRDLLKRFHMQYTIITNNYQQLIDQNYAMVYRGGTSKMDWKHFYNRNEVNLFMRSMAREFPDRVGMVNLGHSYEGRPIWGVKINNGDRHFTVFVEAGIRGNDWISTSSATYFLNELLTNDKWSVRDIADNFNWIIVPIANPDGYVYSFTRDRLWHKSREQFTNSVCVGVDLSRNFGSAWNGTGSSNNPCRPNFAGPSELSSPETLAITRFVALHRRSSYIRAYLSLQGYSQRIKMFPHESRLLSSGKKAKLHSVAMEGMKRMLDRFESILEHGQMLFDIAPPAMSGSTVEWAHSVADIPVALSIDLRGHRAYSDMPLMPAKEIIPIGMETVDTIVGILHGAENNDFLKDDYLDDVHFA